MKCRCGADFEPDHPNQRNCSPACTRRLAELARSDRSRKPATWRTCALRGCGRRFLSKSRPRTPGRHRVYCSDRCCGTGCTRIRRALRRAMKEA